MNGYGFECIHSRNGHDGETTKQKGTGTTMKTIGIIFNELVIDRYKESSRATCLRIIDKLGRAGADGIILGCTELPLLVSPGSSHLPLFDTLELHARAAVDYALSG